MFLLDTLIASATRVLLWERLTFCSLGAGGGGGGGGAIAEDRLLSRVISCVVFL